MKKLFVIFGVIFLGLILASCGRSEDVLRVGMDLRYPPFETKNNKNEAEGISVDVALALGEYLGKKVEIVPMEFGNLIISLQNGTIDIVIASMSITEERSKVVDFSEPYFHFKIISLLNKDFALGNGLNEDSSIEELLAVEDARYIGLASQVSASIPESYGKVVKKSTNIATAIEDVSQGTSDVLLMSASPVVSGHKGHRNTTMVMWASFESSPIGMAVRKGNTDLLAKANEFIDTFKEEGGLYEILSNKWDEIILEELERYGLDFYIEE